MTDDLRALSDTQLAEIERSLTEPVDQTGDYWLHPGSLVRELLAALKVERARREEAINMILFCPSCGLQHVDEPDERTPGWTNPPHRSHLCHGCGHVWRPADVLTNGVREINTKGKADSTPVRGGDLMATLRAERVKQGMFKEWYIEMAAAASREFREREAAEQEVERLHSAAALARPLLMQARVAHAWSQDFGTQIDQAVYRLGKALAALDKEEKTE